MQVLLNLLIRYESEGRKVLIFSQVISDAFLLHNITQLLCNQFTQILDILQAIFKHKDTKYLILTGSTPVDIRQTLVDEFTEDESIPIFLLSTKAGGMYRCRFQLTALLTFRR